MVPEYREMESYRDLPSELLQSTMERVALYSTVLVRQTGNGDWEQNGCGTFVRHGGQFGILTAGHVVRRHQGTDAIGLCTDTGDHLFKLDCSVVGLFEEYESPEAFPDLGFMRIPPGIARGIEAGRKLFYNSERNREGILRAAEDLHCGAWVLWGAPGEQTTFEVSARENGVVQCFSCLAGFTDCERLPDIGPWDTHQTSVKYQDCGDGVPRSMAGFSGGGLWCVCLRQNLAGEFEASDFLLEGVACLQSDLIGEQRTVTCHGPRGVLAFLDRVTQSSPTTQTPPVSA